MRTDSAMRNSTRFMAELWLADGDMASSVWIAPTAPFAGRLTMAKPPNCTLGEEIG